MQTKSMQISSKPREGWEVAVKIAHDNGDDKLIANDISEDDMKHL